MSINSPGFLPCLDSSPSESDTLLLLVRVIHYGMLRTLRHLSFQKESMANVRYPTEVPTDMTIPILSSLSECWNESKVFPRSEMRRKSTCSLIPPPVSTIGWLKINKKQGYPSLHIFWKDKGSAVSAQSNKLRYIGNSRTYWLSYWIGSPHSRYSESMGIESFDSMWEWLRQVRRNRYACTIEVYPP